MAKGLLAGLKGVDAFGKVNTFLRVIDFVTTVELTTPRIDHRRCESQDTHWRFL